MDFHFDIGSNDSDLTDQPNTVNSNLHITGSESLEHSSIGLAPGLAALTNEHSSEKWLNSPQFPLGHEVHPEQLGHMVESALPVEGLLATDSFLQSALETSADSMGWIMSPEVALFSHLVEKILLHFQIESAIKSALEQERESSFRDGNGYGYQGGTSTPVDARHKNGFDANNPIESQVVSFLNSAAHTLEGVHSKLENTIRFPVNLIMGEGDVVKENEQSQSNHLHSNHFSEKNSLDSYANKWSSGFSIGSLGTGLRR